MSHRRPSLFPAFLAVVITLLALPSAVNAQNDPPPEAIMHLAGNVPALIADDSGDATANCEENPAPGGSLNGSDIVSAASESVARDVKAPATSAQQGPCESGIWAEYEGPGIGVVWCRLTSSHYWCWDFVIIQVCQQHCHYGGCGEHIKF
ncbi:hypothetical protein [Candidatus Palauibacter sp.]|uniref:hypothetical protein n=1 Tax=Candidatus Palauibacter sp. TaxID=3101350 RepID=UPI003AF302B6